MQLFYNGKVIGTFEDNIILLSADSIIEWKPEFAGVDIKTLTTEDFQIGTPATMFISIEMEYDIETEKYLKIAKLKNRTV